MTEMGLVPLTGFDQLFDFPLDQVAFKSAHVRDIELAVEVVGLVEERAGEKVFSGVLKPVPFYVLRFYGDTASAGDLLAEVGDAEAAFLRGLAAVGEDDLRINEDQLGVGIFFKGDIDDGDSLTDTDLGGGEADAMGLVHGFEHVVDEFLQAFVEFCDRLGWFLQHWVAKFYDWIDHLFFVLKGPQLLTIAFVVAFEFD